MLNDFLEIILVTYNRKGHLTNTLEQIMSETSPVKDLDITILDNKSTDGSSELIEEYTRKHPNIKHIRHNRNIGGNGNIARAFELASKEYLWVICDDDNYDWTYWREIENAIKQKKDIIIHSKCELQYSKKKNIGKLLRQLTFLPGSIIKTDLVTDDIMQNSMANIQNMFPHLAIYCHVINEGKEIFVTEHEIVKRGECAQTDYIRGFEKEIHPRIQDMFFTVGFINSVQMIKDKKLRKFIIDNMDPKDIGFFRAISKGFRNNRIQYHNSFRNFCDVINGLSFVQKIQFLAALIWLDIVYFVKKFILRKIK